MPLHDFDELGRNRTSWIFLLFALWGGLCHYLAGLRSGQRKFSLYELTGDLSYSGFAGLLAAALAQHLKLSDWATFALCGMAGHMGSRTVFLLERAIRRKWFGEEN